MAKSIIPIGKALGWNFSEDGELESFEWFRGDDILDLTANEAATLAFAFGRHQHHFDLKFDRETYFALLHEQSESLSDAEINQMIDGLLEKGLLVEIDFEAGPLETFFGKYRMVPSSRSFGNTKEQPNVFSIGHTEPSISFSGWSHTIWSISHADGSMWRGCELQAEHLPENNAFDVAKDFAQVLPVIVATECGFLGLI